MFCHKILYQLTDFILAYRLFAIFSMDWTSNITNVHCSVLHGVLHLYYYKTMSSSSFEEKFTEYYTQNNCYDLCSYDAIYIWGIPTTLSFAFEIYGKNSDNYFVNWLGFAVNGIYLVNVILVISYLLNIWVYVLMSQSFRERLLTMLYITSAR